MRRLFTQSIKIQTAFFLGIIFFVTAGAAFGQALRGKVIDKTSAEPLIGASVVVKGFKLGAATDENGAFSIPFNGAPPVTLVVTYIGYDTLEFVVKNFSQPVTIEVAEKALQSKTVEVIDYRVSEKEKESPLTVEKLDLIAIRETPAANFYDGLGNLKGVDVTAAAMGFKVINTRGFNSTQPVRSLQIIDGVDNQAPGLNFALGNMVGASELDVQSVELVVGASSAVYGPNAFNGVISMTTKSPFLFPGASILLKTGERDLFDGAVRYAQVFKNKKGKDKFAFKINAAFMRAYDWEANNAAPTDRSLVQKSDATNPGGYDAVNRYGDENQDERQRNFTDPYGSRLRPGLGVYFRTGYWERDLVDYNTKSVKLGGSLHYKITDSLELQYGYNFGTGTTVFQGDNRYSLKDFVFQQHKIELKHPRFFIRAYTTLEDAGKSYDAVFTALLLQRASKSDADWTIDYENYYVREILEKKIKVMPAYQEIPKYQANQPPEFYTNYYNQLYAFIAEYRDSFTVWHNLMRNYADGVGTKSSNHSRLEPGTPEFTQKFREITSNPSFIAGGSRFQDYSKLYHVQGEYRYPNKIANLTVGGSFRQYAPQSFGSVFSDTLVVPGDESKGYRQIRVYEFGFLGALEKKLLDNRLKLNLAARLDKNKNFNYLGSFALSAVYSIQKRHHIRLSGTTAIRNPTLQDQYLNYNVGRAVLRGNVSGVDSVVTIESLYNYFATGNLDTLKYVFVAGVKPEQVRSVEIGYKGSPIKNVFIDASFYSSWYSNFIGFRFVATPPDPIKLTPPQVYRFSTNATETVTTRGFSIGANYYFKNYFALTGNYSWNKLDKATDPIIPAFNTPEHKFNIGLSGRDIMWNIRLNKISEKLPIIRIMHWGFNVNYKWVQGFQFEGSPQFTGFVPGYDVVDAQINRVVPKWKMTFKLGASNLFNKKFFQAYGGPYIGRLAYFSLQVDL